MFLRTTFLRTVCSLLCQGVLILSNVIPSNLASSDFAPSLLLPLAPDARIHVFAAAAPLKSRAQTLSAPPSTPALDDIIQYISSAWGDLTRTMTNCESLTDAKTSEPPVLYLPAELAAGATPAAITELQKHCAITVEHLPATITKPGALDPASLRSNGLLYLPNAYVVPGGQFNEMYGWDSYFIIRGLLADRRPNQNAPDPANLALAKGMVENFFFEIAHYGGVLNANRTYYLTRSQPPFLTSMILAVYQAEKAHDAKSAHDSTTISARPPGGHPSPTPPANNSLAWLANAYTYAVRDYEQWTEPPHLAGDTGLARYFDRGTGPVPEIMGDPSHYYRGVAEYFLLHEGAGSRYLAHADADPGVAPDFAHPAAPLAGPLFSIQLCESSTARAATPAAAPVPSTAAPAAPAAAEQPSRADAAAPAATATGAQNCAPPQNVALTAEFYKGDRSMRESGFDVAFRFGPFGADTHHYAPVCLNSLLYKTEKDLEAMSAILGRPREAQRWGAKARARQQRIVKYLWDARRGMFFDYDFTAGTRSSYEYATTFYPLWAGLASQEQAHALARNLSIFEQPGGLAMSRRESQAQWDYPYGWAPIQLLAVEGLRRYGYRSDAERIARKFLATVLRNFETDRTIREKYDVVAQSQITHIGAGYAQNVIGFGWTNGVFLDLLHTLSPASRAQLN
jgi:alpha,alpha-trehalase